ncbi:MAG: YggT family protein [Cellulomonas sp.]|uniref:YggT family protein n=1 Tax=Cellulomonas sp. TaxID=40001 RepID=UPI0017D4C5F6|nr:YggT family protein [Cellulomonas sp.]NMM16142.1 YggT family protein [Cellulomonas sp.]NMM30324.1 YggT family protein [Cellulomonas sp.]
MRLIAEVLRLVVLAFFLVLLVRLVLDWVQFFVHDWRPSGPVLVVAEATYTVTDPPLRFLRRLLPPLAIGNVRLDLAFLVLMLACSILLSVLA